MLSKITVALVAGVLAVTSTAVATGYGNGENVYTKQLAQYCIPQDETPGAEGAFYC
jgi:hypothetical protein